MDSSLTILISNNVNNHINTSIKCIEKGESWQSTLHLLHITFVANYLTKARIFSSRAIPFSSSSIFPILLAMFVFSHCALEAITLTQRSLLVVVASIGLVAGGGTTAPHPPPFIGETLAGAVNVVDRLSLPTAKACCFFHLNSALETGRLVATSDKTSATFGAS